VTNKHVLKNLNKIIVRFNPQTDQAAKDFEIESKDSNGKLVWIGHSNPNYDVAVIRVNGDVLQKEGLKFGLFVDDDSIISLYTVAPKMQKNW
jgi:hypothetical protein